MENMKNFYNELNIDRNLSVEDINRELDQIENTWKMREMSNPEKASSYINLVNEARPIFESEESRKEYDDKLSVTNENTEEESPELVEYRKQINKIKEFVDSEQFDVAKVTFEKTLGVISSASLNDEELCELYYYGSEICFQIGLYEESIKYANEMISINPNNIKGYNNKVYSIYEMTLSLKKSGEDYSISYKELISICSLFEKKAREIGDELYIYRALQFFVGVYGNLEPKNMDEVERYAKEMLKVRPGDEWAKNALEAANKPYKVRIEDIELYKQEKAPYQEIYDLSKEIVSGNNAVFNGNAGWVLASKMEYRKDPDQEGMSGILTYHYKYLFTLDVDGNFKRYLSESCDASVYSINNDEFEVNHIYDESDFDEFLQEFDFSSYYSRQELSYGYSVGGCIGAYPGEENLKKYHYNFDKSHFELTREYKKGKGLLNKLIEIKNNHIQPEYYSLSDQERQKKIELEEAEKKQREQSLMWKKEGKCKYCGGECKGFLSKKCIVCGKVQ